MTNDDLLHLLNTAFVEFEGRWYSVPGGWVVNIQKAGLKVVMHPPTAEAPPADKTV